MLRKIEYEGFVHSIFTDKKTQIFPQGTDFENQVTLYAAWRWLCHFRPLDKPFSTLCLGFRQGRWKQKSRRLVLTLPARTAALPGDGFLHILVRLSGDGVCIEAVQRSESRRADQLPHRGRHIFFHPETPHPAKLSAA